MPRQGRGPGKGPGNPGRGDRGGCDGTRRRDGSGGGRGNRSTPKQPAPKK